ncbi:hypothetical protein IH575_00310 [Candidatus Dojkabacteria bacterium]|nr:hypothetical protein [Candidatus Dojkabacteria bacterium]
MYHCPACRKYSIMPNGIQNAQHLIVGQQPYYDDLRVGLPFTGSIGGFLAYELARVGIQLQRCRLVTLYPHLDASYECSQTHLSNIFLPEIKIPRQCILMIGNDLSTIMGEKHTVKELSGLVRDTIPLLGIKQKVVYVNDVHGFMRGQLGEFRFALQNFRGVNNE